MTASTEARNSETKVSLRQRWTRAAQRLVDLLVCALAFQFAYLLRFDFSIPASVSEQLNVQLPYVVVLQVVTLGLFGIQTFIWRYVGMAELKAFIGAALSSAGVLLAARLFLQDPTWSATWRVPLSVIVLDTGLAYGGLVAVRILRRLLHERHRQSGVVPGGDAKARRPVMLIGAGRNGMMAAREIQGNPDSALDIRGFVDDDPNKKGTVIQGVRVLGSTQDLPRLVAKADVDHVVVTIEKLSRAQFQRIRDVCDAIPVKMRIAPSMSQILDGRLQVSRIRDVQVDDLLGRAPVDLDLTDMARLIAGRTVMVTGAGGSIGAELVRQVARFGPWRVLLVERSEFALFNIEREMREALPDIEFRPVLADIAIESRMRAVFEQYRPALVLHAAAHKHVPMLEHNPTEAITNNVLATRTLARLAGEYEVEVFVLISTDKAVRPTSVMGASKRLTELVIQSVNRSFATRYVAVRFGNVIGSAGSVIPIFQEQIRKGGPVVVTVAGHGAVFHDDSRGHPAGPTGGGHGRRRRDLHPRHGRAGAHPRPGQGDDPAVRLQAVRRHRHRVLWCAARREAVRGTRGDRRAPRTHAAPENLYREAGALPRRPAGPCHLRADGPGARGRRTRTARVP